MSDEPIPSGVQERDIPQELADELHFGAKKPSIKRWEPKRWELVYDMIVIASTCGMSNSEIAIKYGYGKQQVSNILNCEMARKVRAKVYVALQTAAQKQIPTTIDELQVDAINRIKDALRSEDLQKDAPLSLAQLSLKFLESTGKIAGKSAAALSIKTGKNSTVNVITAEAASDLKRGLERAREAEQINGASLIRQLSAGSSQDE